MADKQSTALNGAAPVSPTGKPFSDRSGSEKLVFLGKVLVMLCSGGFAFPNIFVE